MYSCVNVGLYTCIYKYMYRFRLIHTCIYTHTYTHIHTHTHTYLRGRRAWAHRHNLFIYIHTCIRTCIHTCLLAGAHEHTCTSCLWNGVSKDTFWREPWEWRQRSAAFHTKSGNLTCMCLFMCLCMCQKTRFGVNLENGGKGLLHLSQVIWYVCVYVCLKVRTYILIQRCVCVYIHTHTHTNTHTYTHADQRLL